MDPQKPTMGRVVHVKLREKDEHGPEVVRAATITHVWTDECVNLQVALDGDNDMRFVEIVSACRPNGWMTSVTKGAEVRQWFWPPRV